ncbi:unnamed protein product, partial [Owenia fusiformis]
FCDLWICNTCENLDENDLALLNASTNGTHWYCHKCEPQVNYIIEQAKSGIFDVAKSVANSLMSIKKDQSLTKKSVDSVSIKVKNLQDLYNNVSQKIDTFNESAKEINLGKGAVENSLKEVAQLSRSFSSVVKKSENKIYPNVAESVRSGFKSVNDQERRRKNIILHNLEEFTSLEFGTAESQDLEEVKQIFEDGLELPNIQIVKTIRLGRKLNKPRLLLVMMKDDNYTGQILSRSRKLRYEGRWTNVYIHPDLSPEDREISRKLREELKERREAGEENLTIRRGKIVCITPDVENQQYHRGNTTQRTRGRGGTAPRGGLSQRTNRAIPPRVQDHDMNLCYRDDTTQYKSTSSLTTTKSDNNPAPQSKRIKKDKSTSKSDDKAKPNPKLDSKCPTETKPTDARPKEFKKSTMTLTPKDQPTPIENSFKTLCDLGQDDTPQLDEDLDTLDTCSVISSSSDNTGPYESSAEIDEVTSIDNPPNPDSTQTPITSVWTSPAPPLSQNCGKALNDHDGLSQATGEQ